MKAHGISLGISRTNSLFFIHIQAFGTLHHEDYQYMVPSIEAALEQVSSPELNVLIDIIELEGWTLHAAWDDYKFGTKHNREFKKVAVICGKRWQRGLIKITQWFTPSEIQSFNNQHDALDWLQTDSGKTKI